jgi:hypothetical protein
MAEPEQVCMDQFKLPCHTGRNRTGVLELLLYRRRFTRDSSEARRHMLWVNLAASLILEANADLFLQVRLG